MGVEVEFIQDTLAAREMMRELDKEMGLALDPSRMIMTQGNSVWIFARRNKKLIVGWGVRVDELCEEDAQQFLPRAIEVLFNVKVTGAYASPYAGKMWGRAAYLGDLISNTGSGLSREGHKILSLLGAYCQFRISSDLRTDITYAFLRETHKKKGMVYGLLNEGDFVWETSRSLYPDGNPRWVMQMPTVNQDVLMRRIDKRFLGGRFTANQQDLHRATPEVEVRYAAGG